MSDIRQIRYADILDAPNAKELIDAYHEECSRTAIGPPDPQAAMYEALEASGKMHCFGVYERRGHPLDAPELIGFATVLVSLLPHYGKLVAVVESIFCMPKGNGIGLMLAIKRFAKEQGCVRVLYSVPIGGRLEHLLQARRVPRTNFVYCEELA